MLIKRYQISLCVSSAHTHTPTHVYMELPPSAGTKARDKGGFMHLRERGGILEPRTFFNYEDERKGEGVMRNTLLSRRQREPHSNVLFLSARAPQELSFARINISPATLPKSAAPKVSNLALNGICLFLRQLWITYKCG
jgi:hypothetical protein